MFRTLIIGAGFGSRVVAGCYEEAGMTVQVVTPRDAEAVRHACAEPFDLISVHSPPFLHAEHVNLALDHHHAVLCDKPFGVSPDEARQMLNGRTRWASCTSSISSSATTRGDNA